jgi:TPR repeat protein
MWSQYSIGIQFMSDEGQDYEQARTWFLKAADQGLWAAQMQIGSIYFEGKGVAKAYAQARLWFLKAANQSPDPSNAPKDPMDYMHWSVAETTRGYAEAYLSQIYSEGDGVPIDLDESRRWLTKAADYKLVFAEAELGKMWQDGVGGPRSDVEARKWYQLGAEGGNAMAENNLGVLLADGRGGPRDQNAAVSWYKKSAEQDYAVAQMNMGGVYYHGAGVKKDYKQAREWFLSAPGEAGAFQPVKVRRG